jgi:anti-sigma B factor antagonist
MDTSLEVVGPVTVITPGDIYLDASRSKEFRREVVDKLSAPAFVLLDLSKIQFIDSSGCGAILACSRQVNPTGRGPGDLKLCGVSKQVRLVFEMVRLHKIMEIYNTREEALRAFDVEAMTISAT